MVYTHLTKFNGMILFLSPAIAIYMHQRAVLLPTQMHQASEMTLEEQWVFWDIGYHHSIHYSTALISQQIKELCFVVMENRHDTHFPPFHNLITVTAHYYQPLPQIPECGKSLELEQRSQVKTPARDFKSDCSLVAVSRVKNTEDEAKKHLFSCPLCSTVSCICLVTSIGPAPSEHTVFIHTYGHSTDTCA